MAMPTRRSLVSLFLAGAALVAGCRTAELNAYNLKEVHHPDGRTKRRGAVHSAWQHVLSQAFRFSIEGAPKFAFGDEERRIDDPLGVCFENLRQLLHDYRGENALGIEVEMVSWLGGDCEYRLSREACALSLAKLGERVGVRRPLSLAEGVEPQGSDEVAARIEAILRATRGLVTSGADEPEPPGLSAVCAEADRRPLDREGARRLLAACNVLLETVGIERAGVEPLVDLRKRLEVVCVGLTLGVMLEDPDPRVRAAAFRSWISLTAGRDADALERAYGDPDPMVLLEAVRSLARRGAPVPEGATAAELQSVRDLWMERLAMLLGRLLDGPLLVACCQAMSNLSGEPADLHPEVWVAWWEERRESQTPADTRP
ncbi:MAG TPA: HEAT repeat domain-containing protein [Planctomycetes bacterium]|nr:HEAT repeat domain-containing protein [Planctomycetota bacterium]